MKQIRDLEVLDEAIRQYGDWISSIPRFIMQNSQWPLTVWTESDWNATAFEAVSVSYAEKYELVGWQNHFIRRRFLNQLVAEKRPDLAYFCRKKWFVKRNIYAF